jgi:hypothetical protein
MVLVNMAVSFARVATIALLRWNSLALRIGGHAPAACLFCQALCRLAAPEARPIRRACRQTAKAPDERPILLHQRHTRDDSAGAFAYRQATMAILIIFLLGVGNFALHRAIMDCGHPLLGEIPWFTNTVSRRFSFGIEFLMLLGGLMLAAQGVAWGALGYLAYSLLNAISAWLILTDRV